MTPWHARGRALAFVLLAGAVMALVNVGWRASGLPRPMSDGTVDPWPWLVFAGIMALATTGVVAWMLRFFEHQTLAAIALRFERRAWFDAGLGCLLGSLPVALLVGLALVGGYGEVELNRLRIDELLGVMAPLLVAGVFVAVQEEIILRGYLLRQLSLGFRPTVGVVVTGLLFGLMHSGNPGSNWEGLVYTAVGGMLMALLLLRSGSLWLVIGYHFGWNTTGFTVLGLELSGLDSQTSLLTTTLTGAEWLTGGSYGFEASLPAALCEVLVLATALYAIGTTGRFRPFDFAAGPPGTAQAESAPPQEAHRTDPPG